MTAAAIVQEQIQAIPLDLIEESPFNHRRRWGNIEELAQSFRDAGVLQPIVLRPKGSRFELVFGHRRTRAGKLADVGTMPSIVRDMSDDQVKEAQAIENIQREDPHPMDEAEGFEQLRAAADERRKREALVEKIGDIAHETIVAKAKKSGTPSVEVWRLVAGALTGRYSADVAKGVAKLGAAECAARCVDELLGDDYGGELLGAAAEVYGVDLAALERQVDEKEASKKGGAKPARKAGKK